MGIDRSSLDKSLENGIIISKNGASVALEDMDSRNKASKLLKNILMGISELQKDSSNFVSGVRANIYEGSYSDPYVVFLSWKTEGADEICSDSIGLNKQTGEFFNWIREKAGVGSPRYDVEGVINYFNDRFSDSGSS